MFVVPPHKWEGFVLHTKNKLLQPDEAASAVEMPCER